MSQGDHTDRIAQLETGMASLWRYLDYKDEEIAARRKADRIGQDVEAYRQEIAKQLTQVSEASARYNSVITLVGYASYFATWSFVRADLKPKEAALVGLLGLTSVAFYVLWEIGSMFRRFRSAQHLASLVARELQPDEFFRRYEEVKLKDAVSSARWHRIWVGLFPCCVLTIACGGAVLMWALARSLFN